MTLSERLNRLRHESGATAQNGEANNDLRCRLERLHVQSLGRTRKQPVSSRLDDTALARLWGATVLAPGLLLIERRVPLTHSHGHSSLSGLRQPRQALVESAGHEVERLCFFDTETSGLSGGTGTIAFLLGMGRVVGSELAVRQYLLTAFSGEAAMLREAANWLGEEGVPVSYNGKSFDAPLLATRCRLSGLANPWDKHPHIDLLHPTRRAFARRWSDCRLATAERNLLGFQRMDDLPGSEVPAVWQEYLHRGDSPRMHRVIEHNFYDILSLTALLPALEHVHRLPQHYDADVTGIARHFFRHDRPEQARQILAANPDTLDDDGKLLLAELYRRQSKWQQAEALLIPLAEKGRSEAIERLAKYHEHQRRDYRTAIRYASVLPHERGQIRRLKRLHGKLGNGGGQLPLAEL